MKLEEKRGRNGYKLIKFDLKTEVGKQELRRNPRKANWEAFKKSIENKVVNGKCNPCKKIRELDEVVSFVTEKLIDAYEGTYLLPCKGGDRIFHGKIKTFRIMLKK